MPKTIVVHGLEVVDAGVVVEAPPGHTIVVETAAPGPGVSIQDFGDGNKRHYTVLLQGILKMVIRETTRFFQENTPSRASGHLP